MNPRPLNSQVAERKGLRLAPLWLPLVIVAECAWLSWFLAEPLPNSGNVGGRVWRALFLWRALPEVVPGVTWEQSHLGAAFSQLRHVENLPERGPIVLAAALIAASAIALGRMISRVVGGGSGLGWLERLALAYPLGATALGVLTLAAGRLGLLAPWPVRGVLVGVLAIEAALSLRSRWRGERPPPSEEVSRFSPASRLGMGLIVGPFLVLMALAAMLPAIDFDALEYHLQGPKEFFLSGRITFLPHNVYTAMPFGVEMLHLLGMNVLNDWWLGAAAGQLLVMLFASSAAVLVSATARRIASPRAGWVAGVVYLTTPWVYRLAAIPYVEGPLTCYHAGLILCGFRLAKGKGDRQDVGGSCLLGLLAGGAMACKYPALLSAVVPFGMLTMALAVRRRSAGMALAFALGLVVTIGPWMVKNVIDTGNPVYPLAYSVFGGRDWDDAREAQWTRAHGRRPIAWAPFVDGVLDIVGRSDWQSPLFTALAPLAILRFGSRRQVVLLWGYVLYLFGTWWLLTHRLDRFWLPVLAPLAILAGVGADWVRSRGWTVVLASVLAVGIVTNFVQNTTALVALNQWTDSLTRLREEVPRMLNPPLAKLDAELPSEAVPLLVGPASVFHLNHRNVYNTVFDREILERIASGQSPSAIREEFHRRGITHVYVDWSEIDRHRKPGGYGFTPFVTPELFDRLIAQGILAPLGAVGPAQDLYRVSPRGEAGRRP